MFFGENQKEGHIFFRGPPLFVALKEKEDHLRKAPGPNETHPSGDVFLLLALRQAHGHGLLHMVLGLELPGLAKKCDAKDEGYVAVGQTVVSDYISKPVFYHTNRGILKDMRPWVKHRNPKWNPGKGRDMDSTPRFLFFSSPDGLTLTRSHLGVDHVRLFDEEYVVSFPPVGLKGSHPYWKYLLFLSRVITRWIRHKPRVETEVVSPLGQRGLKQMEVFLDVTLGNFSHVNAILVVSPTVIPCKGQLSKASPEMDFSSGLWDMTTSLIRKGLQTNPA